MNNPVIWFELYVDDMPRARVFYERMLGVTLEKLNSPDSLAGIELWAFPMAMDRGGAGGALVKRAGVRPGGGGTLVYFACTDCAVEAQRAVEAGGSLFRGKMPIGEYGHIALVHDTEGNLVGLHSMQ
ncbi:VOC family protein [Thiobacillus sp.]|uniref:VOC family protein n=1 Tax=Thiobacillus sp. TaxID=924 RepID=UPI0025D62E9B|nr:VOC family protein [Thiobacillus sp.]